MDVVPSLVWARFWVRIFSESRIRNYIGRSKILHIWVLSTIQAMGTYLGPLIWNPHTTSLYHVRTAGFGYLDPEGRVPMTVTCQASEVASSRGMADGQEAQSACMGAICGPKQVPISFRDIFEVCDIVAVLKM